MGMEKTYEGTIQFGWATDSYDSSGEPASEPREVSVEHVDFAPLIAHFTGEIEQMPPAFSAKKIQGVRAYELARKGEPVELKTKRVTVYEFTIVSVKGSTAQFRVRSSAGTYIRSLAHDLGIAAGIRRSSEGAAAHGDRQFQGRERDRVRPHRPVAAGRDPGAAAVPIALRHRPAAREAADRLEPAGKDDERPGRDHDPGRRRPERRPARPRQSRTTSSSRSAR